MRYAKTSLLQQSVETRPRVSGRNAMRTMPAVPVLRKAASETTLPLQKKPDTQSQSDSLKSNIEHLSHYSLDEVRAHYHPDKSSLQQQQGKTKPTMQMKVDYDLPQLNAAPYNHMIQEKNSAHSKNCGCSSCSGTTQLKTGSVTLSVTQLYNGSGVIQLVCRFCKDVPGFDAEHKTGEVDVCPFAEEAEPESGKEKKKEVEAPKKWSKVSSNVKPGKGERDKRKRPGHGMMTKEQAERYVRDY